MSKVVRTRFAPSPTGPLHIGGVRTALYAWLFAKKENGQFILRIEDTDQKRYVEGAEQYIVDTLEWCGLTPDEGPGHGGEYGPYRQSERKAMYRQYVDQLLENGNAYYAFDTSEELEKARSDAKAQGLPNWQYTAVTRQYMKNSLTLPADEVQRKLEAGEQYVVRVKLPRQEEVKFQDRIRGWVTFHSSQLDDKVLFKSDGMPTYHMANVVDDYLMKITHVIRGEEWLPSTPLHVMLYRYLGWEDSMPEFAHLPLILKPDGNGKLSKRDGDRLGFPVFSLDWTNPETGEKSSGFKERGFLKGAFINMLAFLGWNPGTPQELFNTEELIEAFSLERVGKAGAKFDFEKAKWFNQQYFKSLSPDELVAMLKPELEKANIDRSEEFLLAFAGMMVERVTFLPDFLTEGYYFFETPREYEEKMIRKKYKAEREALYQDLVSRLEALEGFTGEAIETTVKQFMEDNSLGFGDVLPILRISISGIMQGPPIFEMAALLGKEESIARLNKGLVYFASIANK